MRISGLQTHNPFHRPPSPEPSSQADFAETLRRARERALPDGQGQGLERHLPRLDGMVTSLRPRGGSQSPGAFPSDPTTFPSGALKQEAGHRAFGLDELGLFGSSWAVAAPDQEAIKSTPTDPDNQGGPVDPPNPDTVRAPPTLVAGAAYGATIPALTDGAATVSAARTEPRAPSLTPEADLVRFELSVGDGDNEVLKPSGAATPRPREALRRGPASQMAASEVSLLVSEQSGALEVIAAAPQMSAQDRGRLTQAISELAARFGRPLTKLSLNGTLLFASLAKGIGADHGRSSR